MSIGFHNSFFSMNNSSYYTRFQMPKILRPKILRPKIRFVHSPQTTFVDSIVTVEARDEDTEKTPPDVIRILLTPRDGTKHALNFQKNHPLFIDLIIASYGKDLELEKWTLDGNVTDGRNSYDATARMCPKRSQLHIYSRQEKTFCLIVPFTDLQEGENPLAIRTLETTMYQT
jgi:hypothetical protein